MGQLERWCLLDSKDLIRLAAGGTVRIKVKGTDLEIVLWGGADVQRIVDRARTKTQQAPKEITG